MNTDNTAAPGELFNYAAWVLELNRGRGQKTAYIDDQGTLGYAHDCNDWPVAFLGAMYAGIVPVAVNTLLTADDYVYMLQHSRARAALVSNALLGTLRDAMNSASHNVANVFVSGAAASRADGELEAGEQDLEAVLLLVVFLGFHR